MERESKFYYSHYLHLPEVQKELIQNEKIKINITYLHNFTAENLGKYIKRLNLDEIKFIFYELARNGHLSLIKYLGENELRSMKYKDFIDEMVIACAAKNGHLEIVKYLFDSEAPIDEDAIAYAAENGHLEIVKYLVEHNAPIDERAIAWAIKNGHIETVKYLVEHNAPINEDAVPRIERLLR